MATTETILNTIARGTVLVGKITTKGDIRIEGKIIGTITCDSKLVIGKNGTVEGNVDARNAYVEGEIEGTVVIRELLQLQETGRIRGDIYTSKLSVQVGAMFTGNCRMGKDAAKMLENQQEKVEDMLKHERETASSSNGATNRLTTVINDSKEANKAG